jgi:hypothetical protein
MAVSYRVSFARDPATGSVVAEIPALQIADDGADMPEASYWTRSMLRFQELLLQDFFRVEVRQCLRFPSGHGVRPRW